MLRVRMHVGRRGRGLCRWAWASSGWYWSTQVGSSTRHGYALKYTLSCIRVREWGWQWFDMESWTACAGWSGLEMGRRTEYLDRGGAAEESRGRATATDLGAALEVEEVRAPLEARPATVRQALVHALEAHTRVR